MQWEGEKKILTLPYSLILYFLGLCKIVLVKKQSEEIDDETLSPEVPSSISPRPLGGLELNARKRGWDEVSKAGNSGWKKRF